MSKSHGEKLINLADAMVQDILNMSDDEILAESENEGVIVSEEVERLRGLFDAAELRVRKQKLHESQRQVRNSRAQQSHGTRITDIHAARKILTKLQQSDKSLKEGLMLAARKANTPLSELSEEDVLSLANDLNDLGIWHDDEPE